MASQIVGIVSPEGAVLSENTGNKVRNHAEFWNGCRCRWRWNYDQGIWWIGDGRPTAEEFDLIRTHLTKKYGLRWWGNGFHDIDFLMKKSGCKPNF